jgi:hypothetical protein
MLVMTSNYLYCLKWAPSHPEGPGGKSAGCERATRDEASQRSPSLLLYIAVQKSWKGLDTRYAWGRVGGNVW